MLAQKWKDSKPIFFHKYFTLVLCHPPHVIAWTSRGTCFSPAAPGAANPKGTALLQSWATEPGGDFQRAVVMILSKNILVASQEVVWIPHIKTLPCTQCSVTSQPSAACECQPFAFYIAINFFLSFFASIKLLVGITKQNCEAILCFKQRSKTWRQIHDFLFFFLFLQSLQFSVISRQHRRENLISSELGSYFLLKDFSRVDFALKTRLNQHLYCLALHCECPMVWLTDPIFSLPVQHWNEGHLLKQGKIISLKGQRQEKRPFS